ncbi:MAG: hypothetical protein HN904_03900 [Victivallales bacterium]|nr:hypothetical protein [Victivallales bacterium]MBT7161895.1 hypothetical protein [Victivallales bacterium]
MVALLATAGFAFGRRRRA